MFNASQKLKIKNSRDFRVSISTKAFLAFIAIYLPHKFPLDFAQFHKDIVKDLISLQEFIAIMGFRGSAKSTLVEAFALWCLVTGRSPFTVLIRDTDTNSKAALSNIKKEIENNARLQQDFEIKVEQKKRNIFDKWSEQQITVNGNTIIARSRGQKIRGAKFAKTEEEVFVFEDENEELYEEIKTKTIDVRITMIIVDDVENVESTKTIEQRKKTREWFFTEVVPATAQGVLGDNVKVIIIGNLVHKDCLIAYLENQKIVNVHKFGLFDENGEITWKALYPSMEYVEKQKARVMLAGKGMGNIIWNREYLLKLVDDEDTIITDEDIQYYPKEWLQKKIVDSGVGVDLAISEKEKADFTAMVKGYCVLNDYGEKRLLILPNPVNEHLNFANTMRKAKDVNAGMVQYCKWFVEGVSYQKAAIETLKRNGIDATSIQPTSDKRARLQAISSYIKTGIVLFAGEGCEELIANLTGFGTEPHDDLVDALVYLIDGMLNGSNEPIFG